MKKLKTTHLIIAIVTLQALGILSTIPEFIPTWKTAQAIFVFSIYVIIIILVVILFIRMWKLLIQKKSQSISILLSTLMILVTSGYIFFSFAFTFFFSIQLYPPTLFKEINYPDSNITIYIYHSSGNTSIEVRDGRLPVKKQVKYISLPPSDLNIERVDDIIEFKGEGGCVVRFNLRTGKLIE